MTTYTPEDIYNYARQGNSDKLIAALKFTENRINWYKDDNGWNALHNAAYSGRFDCIGILINSGIDVNSKVDYDDDTALSFAAAFGYTEIVELLLNRGADINIRNSANRTALTYAVRNKHIECVTLLLNIGADINIRDNYDQTALHAAARNGHIECVALLFKYGAVINDDIDSYKPFGQYEGEALPDCRPIILAEIEHRRKRAAFDAFIAHHIEYLPYINRIYSLCYPSGDLIVAAPDVGWPRAQSISNKYYFDEVFHYLHMHVAKVCTQASINISSSLTQLATESDATSTLMTVLINRLKLYLKPYDV